jgi:hypothetical protein
MAAGIQIFWAYGQVARYRPNDSHVEILEVVCDPTGLDATGAVRSKYLTLHGRAVLIDLGPVDLSRSGEEHLVQRDRGEISITLDMAPESQDDLY